MSKLILIFALIGFCLTEDTDQCYSDFKDFLDDECEAINTNCKYFISIKKCTEPKSVCTGGTSSTCSSIIPTDFNTKKCKWDGAACNEVDKLCEDYDSTWGDTCSGLKVESGKGDECRLSYSKKCTPHFDSCTSITKQDQCVNNILAEPTQKCIWKNNACTQEQRSCDDSYHELDSTDCPNLKATDSKKKCFYLNKACGEYYEKCEDYEGKNKTICENLKPINSGKNGFDISKNCTFDDSSKICKTTDIMCEEYILKGAEDNRTCFLLATSDIHKKCIYDYEIGSCREDYLSCQEYNDLTNVQKKKEICENITLDDVTKKCVFKDNACSITNKECSDYKSYEPKENCTKISTVLSDPTKKTCKFDGSKCIEDYISCTSYKGQDKETCESIMVSNGKCFLEKDIDCKQKELSCSEAKTESDCWYVAKAENSRKFCFYYGDQCIEMYSACENYLGYYKQECEAIVTLKGTSCVFQSPNCISIIKSCSEALNYIDCLAINELNAYYKNDPSKSRLWEPAKMICDYDSTTGCFENYKYCNDYTGTDAAVCEKIKPYTTKTNPDSTTVTGPDSSYKCVYNEKTGCGRQLLKCSEAKTPSACRDISKLLQEVSDPKKYCLFFNGTCTEQYYECSEYKKNVQKEVCQAIIPNNYKMKHCLYKDENDKISCVEADNVCESFDVDRYKYECTKKSPFCSYSEGICSTVAKACSDIVFPLEFEGDKAKTCSGIKVENENKICSLSSDKTKCEEVDKPSEKEETPASSNSGTTPQNNQNSESQEDSSDSSKLLQLKGIKLILTLLNLLI